MPGGGVHGPYYVRKRDDKWVVVNRDGEVKGTHGTRAEALKQQAALYVNIPEARDQAEKAHKSRRLATPPLDAPGYSRYPGQTGLNRRDNAIDQIKKQVGGPAYDNARRILVEEYGYTDSDIMKLRRTAAAPFDYHDRTLDGPTMADTCVVCGAEAHYVLGRDVYCRRHRPEGAYRLAAKLGGLPTLEYGATEEKFLGFFDVDDYLSRIKNGVIKRSYMGYWAGYVDSDGQVMALTQHRGSDEKYYKENYDLGRIRLLIHDVYTGISFAVGQSFTSAQVDTILAIMRDLGHEKLYVEDSTYASKTFESLSDAERWLQAALDGADVKMEMADVDAELERELVGASKRAALLKASRRLYKDPSDAITRLATADDRLLGELWQRLATDDDEETAEAVALFVAEK